MCNVQLNLAKAFSNHEDNPHHFNAPRHKNKKSHSYVDEKGKRKKVNAAKPSYKTSMVNGNIKLEADRIKLPKLGWMPCANHRDGFADGKVIKSVTVWRDAAENYRASILFEQPHVEPTPVKKLKDVLKSIGYDYSSPYFYVASDGTVANHPRPMRDEKCELKRKLEKAKEQLSRKRKGSKNYEKLRRQIGEIERKIANVRKDWIEKESTRIANEYDVVCVESLNMHGHAQALNFGKAVHDNAWGMFLTRLGQKLEERGKYLVRIDPRFPSSRLCRECNWINDLLELGESPWTCPHCGAVHDRDPYAAETIRLEGLRKLSEEMGIPRWKLGLPALDAA